MTSNPVLFTLAALGIAGAAHAQSADGTAADAIVVTATRTPQPADQVGESVSVVDRATIVDRQTVAVADLLATLPGVSFSRSGSAGGLTTVNLRGAPGDETLVLIDGVRVNDPSSTGGAFDFGALVAGNLGHVEVLRGSNSVAWGSQAIGGVIDFESIAPGDQLHVDAAAEGGYASTALGRANVSGKIGGVGASAGLSYLTTAGISSYDAGTERDSDRNLTANARLLVPLGGTATIDLRGYYIHANNGIDGYAPAYPYAFEDSDERSISTQYVGYAGLNWAMLDGRLTSRIGYSRFRIDRRTIDPSATPQDEYVMRGDDGRLEYQGRLALIGEDRLALVGGYEHERPSLASTFTGTPTEHARSSTDSGYGLAVARPIEGLSLTGGVRYDHHSQFGGATTLGANGAWSLGHGTLVRASYGEGFKAPTLYQLYGDYGNTALRPERSRSVDAGIEQRLIDGRMIFAATWFHRVTRSAIDFVSCYGVASGICADRPYGTYDNIDRARAQGIETSVEMHPNDALSFGMGYTHTDARDRETGNRLARQPKDVETASADYRWPFGLSTGATLLSVGDSYDDAANTRRLAGYVRTDLRASLPLGHGLELYGRIENLFDVGYETVYQYGSYGRAAYAGVRFTL